MSGEKDRIRAEYRMRRASIPEAVRKEKSVKIVELFSKSKLFLEHDRILCYAPLPEEADIMSVRGFCYETGKRIAFPKVCGDELLFYELRPDDILIEGYFHVPEPNPADSMQPVSWEHALCLTPGVVFDHFGSRYGYGKGFYDRYFAAHPTLFRCGVSFAEQVSAEQLPTDPTDLPMQILLTDEGIAFKEGMNQNETI